MTNNIIYIFFYNRWTFHERVFWTLYREPNLKVRITPTTTKTESSMTSNQWQELNPRPYASATHSAIRPNQLGTLTSYDFFAYFASLISRITLILF